MTQTKNLPISNSLGANDYLVGDAGTTPRTTVRFSLTAVASAVGGVIGAGTVSNVALSVPSFLSVTGSPVTTTGTLAISLSGIPLPVANGGSGTTTLSGYLKGNGTAAFSTVGAIPTTDTAITAQLASTGVSSGVSLVGGAQRIVDSIAVLRTVPKTANSRVLVTGYYSAGDGGGGNYWYDSTDTTSVDNGGTIIVATDGGRWKLCFVNSLRLEQFGALGDGVTTGQNLKFDAALAALAAGGTIDLPGGAYLWSAGSTINKACKIRGSGATVKIAPGFSGGNVRAFTVTAADVTFEGVTFDATGGGTGTNDNVFVWSTSDRTTVRSCRAMALSGAGSNLNCAFASSSASTDFVVDGCSFNDCPGAAFSQGVLPKFVNNIVRAPKDVSFALNSTNCAGGQVIGNQIFNGTAATLSGHIAAEEGATRWIITNNYCYGIKDGYAIGAVSPTVTTVVEGGIIADNIIDATGPASAAPSALISVSVYYQNTKIENNRLLRMNSGLASNAAIVAPLKGTMIRGNKIDATSGASSAGAIQLTPAGGDCYIFDNDIDCTGGASRHVVLGNGSNSNAKLYVRGGRFIGGTTAIDYNLNSPTNIGLWIENIGECTATNVVAVSTALTSFGDRQTYFNTHNAARWPHSIKSNTVMWGNAIPTNGTYSNGDQVWYVGPIASNPPGAVCVTGGTPGAWKAMANLAA